MMIIPTGFRFNPTDEELIEILQRKVSGQEMSLHDHFIDERNVYELDPQDLEWDHKVVLSDNERYCYYIRETDSREVSGRGWWRATGHVKKIYSKNLPVGYRRPLTFLRFTDNERKRKNAFKTNWIMHEYSLHSYTTEWRLCKIKHKGKASVKEEPESITKGYRSSNDLEGSNSILVTQLDFVGEEQQQPQLIELENLCETYSHVSSSTGMQLDFIVEPVYFRQTMEIEVMDEQQKQSNALYDPVLTHISSTNYYLDDALKHPDSSEELFPSLWS
ncbi:NAC domain-containing protein 41-like [Mangifera indica]|uniref:NAC domain-containing protein 41-like n=1 Tax=Mangifera indica TaxID=29780 RepID=UPI001CFA1D5B|nr:NAC domain-containing protein 41-like [Mangifera indica]